MPPSLSKFKGKRILLVTHSGCDVDAFGAAGALYFSLRAKNSVRIIVPEHINQPALMLAQRMRIPYALEKGASLPAADCIILVDFNSLSLAGKLGETIKRFKGEKILLDHHAKTGEKIAPPQNSRIDPKAVACCEIIFDWLRESKIPLSKEAASCIAAGIITDSVYFLTANSRTFCIMAEAMQKTGKNLAALLALFEAKKAFDEKIAALKAARRAKIFRAGDYIIATAQVGAFEADAASVLVKIGADIAFAGDSENGKMRLSGRAAQSLLRETGFHLAKHVFQPLAAFFPGSGGGHQGAAGFNGECEKPEEALKK
ncbi:MAG: DHH family phosphoesterase, partial [Candidatus Diapherotrites archaeon]|nr:DHH family phosphoesterase [Candidatus Diapherotrites archaeon]